MCIMHAEFNDLKAYGEAVAGMAEKLSQDDLEKAISVSVIFWKISTGQLNPRESLLDQFAFSTAQQYFGDLPQHAQLLILEAISAQKTFDGFIPTYALSELRRITSQYPDPEPFDFATLEEPSKGTRNSHGFSQPAI